MKDYPSVTFAIAVLNEEKRIRRCLESILSLDYPKNKIEIIVSDGGSKDRTITIALSYGCKILYNKRQLAEPGLADSYRQATGNLVIHLAVDNILPEKRWLKKMVVPFIEDQEVVGAYCKVCNDPQDYKFNKYFNDNTDPFNAFVYNSASHPDNFYKIYRILEKKENYIIYDYQFEEFPLLALAQGFILKRKDFYRDPDTDYDDILPILDLIRQKKKIAYVIETAIYHYSLKGFRDFLKKYNIRLQNALKYGFKKREKFLTTRRKIRQYLWFPYSLSIVLPFIIALSNSLRKKKLYYFYHPLACFGLTIIIIFNILKKLIK